MSLFRNTKNSLMMKVGDKTKTVDSDFEEARKQFLAEAELQLVIVKDIQKQEEHMHGTPYSSLLSLSPFPSISYLCGIYFFNRKHAKNDKIGRELAVNL
jgi:hypothetical protein